MATDPIRQQRKDPCGNRVGVVIQLAFITMLLAETSSSNISNRSF